MAPAPVGACHGPELEGGWERARGPFQGWCAPHEGGRRGGYVFLPEGGELLGPERSPPGVPWGWATATPWSRRLCQVRVDRCLLRATPTSHPVWHRQPLAAGGILHAPLVPRAQQCGPQSRARQEVPQDTHIYSWFCLRPQIQEGQLMGGRQKPRPACLESCPIISLGVQMAKSLASVTPM